MFAKYNEQSNAAVVKLLSSLSNDEREKERGSYYKSLSGLVRHIAGGTMFFCSAFKDVSTHPTVKRAFEPLETIGNFIASIGSDKITEAQWRELVETIAKVDKVLVDFCSAINDADLQAPVKWFSGNPPTVPLAFMLSSLYAHNTHHRGQVSQILDELKIEHNFSGISTDLAA
jgi:uncharacterized damage-inducible protein DinB